MVKELTGDEIDQLLDTVMVAHLGCQANGKVYVVPISFVREGNTLLGHTTEGMKVDFMRENPEVCVQVEQIKDLGEWESAILWGKFKELQGPDEIVAMIHLIDRYGPVFDMIPKGDQRGRDIAPPRLDGKAANHVVYKIVFSERTGRAEYPNASIS